MTERNFVVWDGKTVGKRSESNGDTKVIGEKSLTLNQARITIFEGGTTLPTGSRGG